MAFHVFASHDMRHVFASHDMRQSPSMACYEITDLVFLRFLAAVTPPVPPSPPNPPTNPRVSDVTDSSVTLAWDSGDIGFIVRYVIRYKAKDELLDHEHIVSGDSTEYTVQGLRPHTQYEFRVQAANYFSVGAPIEVEVTTAERGTIAQAFAHSPFYTCWHTSFISPSFLFTQF